MKQDIEKPLKSLPRNAASRNFTASVISRLEPVKGERPLRGLAAAGIAALLISAAAGGQYLQERRAEARLDSLRAEQQRLASELEELKKITEAYAPVLYVGGTEEADIYVDLRQQPDPQRGNRHVRQASGQITTDF